jgi:hypothetical protein
MARAISPEGLAELKRECTDRDLTLADTLMAKAEEGARRLKPKYAKDVKQLVETARMLRGFHSKTNVDITGELIVKWQE